MAVISNAQHLAFLKLVKEELAKADPCALAESIEQEAFIKKHLVEMEQLFADYQHHLKSIYAVIQKYELVKKEARIMLRKRIAASKKKTTKESAILKHTISKAS
jgi:hypothetical protein